MSGRVHRQWVYIRRYVMILPVCAIALASVMPAATLFAEEQTPDTTKPVLIPSIKDGEVRGTTTIGLESKDEHLASSSIEVLTADEHSFVPQLITTGDDEHPLISLKWNTKDVADGDYKIKYAASDLSGNTETETYPVKVNNAQPFVTLNDTADGRTIGGSISRNDVTFLITAGGNKIDAAPTIAQNPDETGAYIWTLVVPASIVDGSYTIDVRATVTYTGKESASVTKSIQLTTPAVTSGQETAAPVIQAPLPVLDFSEEIGQFIAPELPVAAASTSAAVQSTDSSSSVAQQPTASPSLPVVATASAAIRDVRIDDQQNDAPLVATASGWKLLGVGWQWWLLIGSIITAAAAVTVRSLKNNQPRDVYIGAESI